MSCRPAQSPVGSAAAISWPSRDSLEFEPGMGATSELWGCRELTFAEHPGVPSTVPGPSYFDLFSGPRTWKFAIVPILYLRKLKIREWERPAQGHTAGMFSPRVCAASSCPSQGRQPSPDPRLEWRRKMGQVKGAPSFFQHLPSQGRLDCDLPAVCSALF